VPSLPLIIVFDQLPFTLMILRDTLFSLRRSSITPLSHGIAGKGLYLLQHASDALLAGLDYLSIGCATVGEFRDVYEMTWPTIIHSLGLVTRG
jgi:hypothetical protein